MGINPDNTIEGLRSQIERLYAPSRERSLALTKLDEVELWLWLTKAERIDLKLEDERGDDLYRMRHPYNPGQLCTGFGYSTPCKDCGKGQHWHAD